MARTEEVRLEDGGVIAPEELREGAENGREERVGGREEACVPPLLASASSRMR